MSETPSCTQNLLSTLYTLNLLFLHIPECKLLKTKFLNTLFMLDTASLEPSEIEVRSISLIISINTFLPLLSLSTWNFTFIPFFFKNLFTKTILTFFQ